ncbi:hypothetical protein TWF730_003939 [Orbilia blumenaviensis]|uniref:Peptidase S8/S53 domain-containing protein n=1 Tax=Orbilia blumenaviensis TaxID=1796055 RepID=A0AAV9U466_9PEZI
MVGWPPRKQSVQEISSSYLGTWGLHLTALYSEATYNHYKSIISQYTKLIAVEQCFEVKTTGTFGPGMYNAASRRFKAENGFKEEESMESTFSQGLDAEYNSPRTSMESRRTPMVRRLLRPRVKAIFQFSGIVARNWPPPSRQLKQIAQPPGTAMSDMLSTFYTYSNSGGGVLIYVMDSGCDLGFEDFDHIDQSTVDWIFCGDISDGEKDDANRLGTIYGNDDNHVRYHGTLVAGHIVGRLHGTAPGGILVVVKILPGRNIGHGLSEIEAFLRVYDHMRDQLLKTPSFRSYWPGFVAVFAYNRARPSGKFSDTLDALFKELMIEFMKYKGYVFTTAGNGYPNEPITHFPAVLREKYPGDFKNLVVVGGVNSYTGKNEFQTGNFVQLHGPATHIEDFTAQVQNPKDPKFVAGTSYATPLVAGVFAAILTHGFEDPLKKMEEWAYQRAYGEPKVVWNGITKDKWEGAALESTDGSGLGSSDPHYAGGECSSEAKRNRLC